MRNLRKKSRGRRRCHCCV